jgi:mxaJ protein
VTQWLTCVRTTHLLAVIVAFVSVSAASGRELLVCAGPNNLPFPNEQRQGFENKIGAMPAHALSRCGIVTNVRGYTVYGDYSQANPPRRIIDAVGKGEIDVAIAWGPMAAYFAREQLVPMMITPIEPLGDGVLPMSFAVAVGVRRTDAGVAAEIDHARIDAVLRDFGVPRVQGSATAEHAAHDEESTLRPVKPTSSNSSLTVP